jgi:putative SOS response-associated peptidase YedK
MRRIHNAGAHLLRMPALLAKEDREPWLAGSVIEAKTVLKQYPPECLTAYQLSRTEMAIGMLD